MVSDVFLDLYLLFANHVAVYFRLVMNHWLQRQVGRGLAARPHTIIPTFSDTVRVKLYSWSLNWIFSAFILINC